MARKNKSAQQSPPPGARRQSIDDLVDEAGRESFPASDPPAYSVLPVDGDPELAADVLPPRARARPKTPK